MKPRPRWVRKNARDITLSSAQKKVQPLWNHILWITTHLQHPHPMREALMQTLAGPNQMQTQVPFSAEFIANADTMYCAECFEAHCSGHDEYEAEDGPSH